MVITWLLLVDGNEQWIEERMGREEPNKVWSERQMEWTTLLCHFKYFWSHLLCQPVLQWTFHASLLPWDSSLLPTRSLLWSLSMDAHWNPLSLYTCASKFREVQTSEAIIHTSGKKSVISLSAKVWEAFHKSPPKLTMDPAQFAFSSFSVWLSLSFTAVSREHASAQFNRRICSLPWKEIVYIWRTYKTTNRYQKETRKNVEWVLWVLALWVQA